MSVRPRSARLVAFGIVAAAVSVAACSDSTAPGPARPVERAITARGPQAVLIPEDTLACHSGWIIADGRYHCM